MGKVQRYKRGIAGFINSEKGQRFFNFAYSIGAAIVIWGALFKILHLPGGNTLLSVGMGTEVMMFVLTAFDRPPREYRWEKVYPALDKKDDDDDDEDEAADAATANAQGAGTIIINGGGTGQAVYPSLSGDEVRRAAGIPADIPLTEADTTALSESIAKMSAAADQLSRMAELTTATQTYLDQIAGIAAEMQHLQATTRSLNNVSEILLQSFDTISRNSEAINDSSRGYVEQMQALDRNVSGLNTIYEIQLKSVSSQLDSIDRVNRGIKDIRDMYEKSAAQSAHYCEETERMARYMQQLNSVYEKMITAMTINMYRPMMNPDGTMPGANPAQQQKPENL
jgi:gliding motility-associated protein GldL